DEDGSEETRVVIGGAGKDEYLWLDELSPGGKNPLHGRRVRVPGGGGFNVVVGYRRLAKAARLVFLTQRGADRPGRALGRRLKKWRIDTPLPPLAGKPTSLSYILTETGGRGTILVDAGARLEPIP